ncbi:MAG: hypothetical protein GXC73_03305 [Chitinophagaceae bacterium]|nr:hypothetical protein [Chitinophagaceae bacterium]
MKFFVILFLAATVVKSNAQSYTLTEQDDRWAILADGSIQWIVNGRLPHQDHIEMGGEKVAMWMQYAVDSNAMPKLSRTLVFPSFRLLPQRTIAHMMYNVEDADLPRIYINDRLLKAGVHNATVMNDMPEKVRSVTQNGIMQIDSEIGKDGLQLKRYFFPSVDKAMAFEKLVFFNNGKLPVKVEMEYLKREIRPAAERTSNGPHHFIITTTGEGLKTIQPGDSAVFAITFQATRATEPVYIADINNEQLARRKRVSQIKEKLVLETPDNLLNTMFAFAKVRSAESIYNTKGGYMHGPGGLRYYAAIWANDQAEYVNPFFAFLGDEVANKSAMNSFRMFAKYMNPEYKPIPSSIIAEGAGVWQGAKDRGDMAMIAYGAGRYALAYGNVDSAKVLWPLVEWCLEYLKRKLTSDGVVYSDSDELEGRFPAGKANLNTSSLYYDALLSAAYLGKMLGISGKQLKQYQQDAAKLRANIEKYFGATIDGFQTYRYYKGNDTLRAWITTPLTVDIFDRKEGTVAALFSPRLWTEDGLASLAGNKTFWDRSTLYGLRGAFAAGETEKAFDFLKYFSRRRLLGEHVPYAVEAYPEGNQRHLSAESGLYCRIYTEGMFGIRPTGFNSFVATPRLPDNWDKMSLKNVHAFGHVFDMEIKRARNHKLEIIITKNNQRKTYLINNGKSQMIVL